MGLSIGLSGPSEQVALTIAANLGQSCEGISDTKLRKLQKELVANKGNLSDLDKITLWCINGCLSNRKIIAQVEAERLKREGA